MVGKIKTKNQKKIEKATKKVQKTKVKPFKNLKSLSHIISYLNCLAKGSGMEEKGEIGCYRLKKSKNFNLFEFLFSFLFSS